MNPILAGELLAMLGSEKTFFEAPEAQLRNITGARSRIYSSDYRKGLLDEALNERRFIADNRISTLYFRSPDYPERLLRCDDAPAMLYGLGNVDLNAARIVAIVGTRQATAYGVNFVNKIVEELAERIDGLVIVSGLAYGIDIAAHRAALKCGVPTVAVLAHGLNTIYPADHRSTAVKMVNGGGMLLSDYRSVDSLHKGNFLARNRIIAGLSDCTIVAESAVKGGAMVTANIAAGYNRDVFALPGRTSDKYSAGCNRLIASNVAALLQSADELAQYMQWPVRCHEDPPALPLELTDNERLIVDTLTARDDATLSEFIAATGLPTGKLMSMLIELEFRNIIMTLPGGRYRLA